LIETILAKHPAEYMLFGTDSPWADQRKELDLFMALPMSDEAKRQALWENAERFIQRG
jgi:predicted TIM-barrel fold metal-dependent hydrolase